MDLNIDVNKIVQGIISKKSLFLAVVVVVVFGMIAVFLYGDFSSKIATYNNENQTKAKKIERITEYQQSKENLKKFVSSLPKTLGPDELVSLVEDYAINNRITIVNISSKDMQRQTDYKTMEIDISIRAPSFKDLISFFYTVEKSPYSFKIQTLLAQNGETPGSLECDIVIIATELNT